MRHFKGIGYMLLGALVTGICFFSAQTPLQAAPGTHNDPLVTLSYVDKKFAELDTYLESKLGSASVSKTQTVQGQIFEVVNMKDKTMVYFGDSTECILRAGKALAISSASGGLADLTGGQDLGNGKGVPKNHLILNPKNDGRGMAITENAWLMIKGPYTVVTEE